MIMEYMRVFSPILDRGKRWYILHSKLPQFNPSRLVQRAIFSHFRDEVAKVSAWHLTTEDGEPLTSVDWFKKNYKLGDRDLEVHLVTSFGFYAGMLGHKNTSAVSQEFDFYRALLNSFDLDDVRAKTAQMPAKNVAPFSLTSDSGMPSQIDSLQQHVVQQDKNIENLLLNLKSYEEKIKTLQAELGNFTSRTGEDLDNSTLQEISASSLAPSVKTKRMNVKAEKVFRNLQDVAVKHRESLASVLGYLSCQGNSSEVRDILGEIASKIAREKGVGKAVEAILSQQLYQDYLRSLRVPDWVLLYFKLSARLPDEAWQMLLNLTRLGNTGVSQPYYPFVHLKCKYDLMY